MSVPREYRLDHVAHRLIERLEATRRSWPTEGDAMEKASTRIANEVVEAALGEYRAVAMADTPEVHEAFLRREVSESFLPRYVRLAKEMTATEHRGYGFGPLATPIGRIVIAAAAILVLLMSLRLTGRAIFFSLPLILALPFVPDVLGWIHHRSYRRQLEALLDDMEKIQNQASDYIAPSRLKLAEDEIERGLRAQPEKEIP